MPDFRGEKVPFPDSYFWHKNVKDWAQNIREYMNWIVNTAEYITTTMRFDKRSDLEIWAVIALDNLRAIRTASERLSRRLVVDMVRADILSQRQAAYLAGYNRHSVAAWLKDPDKAMRGTQGQTPGTLQDDTDS